MLPTPKVARLARDLVASRGIHSVWFGAAAPLGLLAPGLREHGVRRIVAQTHGHEVGWAALPGARSALARIARGADVVTYLGEYTRRRLAPVVEPHAELVRLPPGVDIEAYHPGVDGGVVRERHALTGRPVIVCVSRLVARKGQDALVRALPAIRERVPGAALLLVGDGPYRGRLEGLARREGVAEHVIFTGSVSSEELPAHYAAGDVFAMPCRTRRAGLDVEGLGMVYLEASAVGLPVLAGGSGGAPDAVREGETGYVVPGDDPRLLIAHLVRLLGDPLERKRLGEAGRSWVEREWRWDTLAARMGRLLES
jgi:phosphatidylinositol alpha-1,6-mannosyltransferase